MEIVTIEELSGRQDGRTGAGSCDLREDEMAARASVGTITWVCGSFWRWYLKG